MKIVQAITASIFIVSLAAPAFSQDKGSESSKAQQSREGTKDSAPGSAAVPAGSASDNGDATQQSRTKKD